ncbi:hypothetical protein AB6V29_01375 [Microbacterium sp. 20-116]|uniref:hypothetical protein n=1 Tax=Microbacterium sp. 20-116 TaxID=3239883 RepID=UPI0034E1E9B3
MTVKDQETAIPSLLERYWVWIALGFMIAAVAVPAHYFSQHQDQPLQSFKVFGVWAAILGAVGAGIRLWAHNGSKHLDALGKSVGFTAATVAAFAVAFLFLIDQPGVLTR